MTIELELKLLPEEAANLDLVRQKAAAHAQILLNDIQDIKILRRSIDARSRQPYVVLKVAIYKEKYTQTEPSILSRFKDVSDSKPVLVLGAGPAGYFAALELIELGLKPIVLDRGKDARARRRDLKAIQQYGIVDPHSNYCYGEGGAGTYSDGKLYTRSQKRGNIEKSLRLFVEHGANPDILVDAHPHIGSNKLPQVVMNMRETILHYGGEVHFETFITDLLVTDDKIHGAISESGKEYFGDAMILATGHSARDMFYLLDRKKIRVEAKAFALGVRIEHPQQLVDSVQYNTPERGLHLPAASYSLVCQTEYQNKQRGVFSFCMCPGGLVVPASTSPGELVINGMSMSRRDSAYANSGTVVSIELEDLAPYQKYGVFAGLEFQKHVEQTMFQAGDGSQKAPSQRIPDFVNKKISSSLCGTSYIPGLYSAPMHDLLPKPIFERLRQGVTQFGKMMRGYYSEETNVIGCESRTSSPIRVPRNRETYMHEDCEGLFPCGEGAGFAGGILSAAMDGQNCAKAVAVYLSV